MLFSKIQLSLYLNKSVEKIDKKYYSVLGWILDAIDNDQQIYQNTLSISPLINLENNQFKIFVSLSSEKSTKDFINKITQKKQINLDKLYFDIQAIQLIKTFDPLNFQPKSDYKKVLFTFQSPTCFSTPQWKPYIDIQPFPIFKSINKKLLKLWIDLKLDLLQIEKNIRLIWIKNLNTEKAQIKSGFKVGFYWKLFYEVKGDDLFKKQIHFLVESAEFTGVGLNPRLGMWNVYWKVF